MDNKGSNSQPNVDFSESLTGGVGYAPENFNPDIGDSLSTDVTFAPSSSEIGGKVNGIFSGNMGESGESLGSPNPAEHILNDVPHNPDETLGKIQSISSTPIDATNSQSNVSTDNTDYRHTSPLERGKDIIRKFNSDGDPASLLNSVISAREHYDKMENN